jgi:hypothetical protein
MPGLGKSKGRSRAHRGRSRGLRAEIFQHKDTENTETKEIADCGFDENRLLQFRNSKFTIRNSCHVLCASVVNSLLCVLYSLLCALLSVRAA